MAISKLTNQSILRSLAQVSPQAAIRQSAVQRITDDQYLLGRLSIEPSAAVRQSIVETLRTQAALQQVALSGYHRDNRDEALNRLRILSPESAGNALGIDRLIMLFADTRSIDDVVAFTPEEI